MPGDALIIMRNKINNKYVIYCVLYKHWDGYINMFGINLLKYLSNINIFNNTNNFNNVNKNINVANGVGCLFAQIIAHYKITPGDFYITAPVDDDYMDFKYYIDVDEYNKEIGIKIKIANKVVYNGNIYDAINFIENVDDDEDTY